VVPLAGISWQGADAGPPFPDASFDAVVCQFGIMFTRHGAGLRGSASRAGAGRTLLANVALARRNPAYRALNDALAAMFPDDPPRFLQTPYGYHDRSRILADAAAGGFTDVRLDDVRLQGHGPSASDFVTGFVRGTPLNHELTRRGAYLDHVASEAARAVGRVTGSAPITVDLAATVITATRAP
jgi:hypothetical protein